MHSLSNTGKCTSKWGYAYKLTRCLQSGFPVKHRGVYLHMGVRLQTDQMLTKWIPCQTQEMCTFSNGGTLTNCPDAYKVHFLSNTGKYTLFKWEYAYKLTRCLQSGFPVKHSEVYLQMGVRLQTDQMLTKWIPCQTQ